MPVVGAVGRVLVSYPEGAVGKLDLVAVVQDGFGGEEEAVLASAEEALPLEFLFHGRVAVGAYDALDQRPVVVGDVAGRCHDGREAVGSGRDVQHCPALRAVVVDDCGGLRRVKSACGLDGNAAQLNVAEQGLVQQ